MAYNDDYTNDLTADQLIELWDADETTTPELIAIFDAALRNTTRAQLAHLRNELSPCCSGYYPPGEPHGMHSDDGLDYLQCALDLSTELLALDNDAQSFYHWLNAKIHTDDLELTNYPTDGISDAIYALFPHAFD